jgi:4-diphosphocytidyl-2-C-methyl-D-erythritol kinase
VPGAPALPLPFPVLSGPAPAKINLSLDILGPREDGYHELATVLQTLALAGEVRAGPAPGAHDTIAASGPFAEGTPLDDTNFALAALTALRALGVAVPPLAVHLVKRVPAAGGLGGGASDAATVLRLVQRALDLPDAIVARAAEQVGSDEPALLLGGTVLAEGRGERVTPLPGLPVHGVVLFLPGVQVERKTGRMFAARARIGAWDDGSATRRLTGLFATAPHLTPGMLSNGFEPVIDALVPGLGALRHAIEQRIGEPVRLAGAGPALFWIGEPERAAAVAEAARGLDCAVVPTETAPSPWLS